MTGESLEGDYQAATLKLLDYCRSRDWAGVDPYDAMNSGIWQSLPFLNFRVARIALTQLLKRSPLDFRRLLKIEPTQNSKALGIFLSALLKLRKLELVEESAISGLVDNLIELRSPGREHWCWGYSFAWQTRTQIVPRGEPNLVCTTFVANALLDAFEETRETRCLEMAFSAGEYILRDLYWTGEGGVAGFSYPLPSIRAQVHNANLLAAGLFCRISHHTRDTKFLEPALRVARYSANRQAADGSWKYGELPTQGWVDNFHTGYNLSGLRAVGRHAATEEFEPHVRKGFDFYLRHFIREDGAARYFHNATYPIDSHCIAQSILTLLEFKHLDPRAVVLAKRVSDWALDHMWDERGYFYYRQLPWITIKIDYMRWVQAWMLLAFASLVENLPENPANALETAAHANS